MRKIALLAFIFALGLSALTASSKYLWSTGRTIELVANKIDYKDNILAVANNNVVYIYKTFGVSSFTLKSSYILEEEVLDIEVLSTGDVGIAINSISTIYTENDSVDTVGRDIEIEIFNGNDIDQEGSNLYVANQDKGLTIYNLGNNRVEDIISNYRKEWGLNSIEPQWPLLYTANKHGVATVNLSNLKKPMPFGNNYDVFSTSKVAYCNDYLFAVSSRTLNILDVSIPGKLKKFTSEVFPYNIHDIKVKDNEVFVILGDGGFVIYHIDENKEIYQTDSYDDGTFIEDIAFIGDYILVVRRNQDIKIVGYN